MLFRYGMQTSIIIPHIYQRSLLLENLSLKGTLYPCRIFSWWRHPMETFSALLAICAGNSPVPGEFPTPRQVTRSFDVFFDLRQNKMLSKQWWGWWFETPSCPLWRHCNVITLTYCILSLSSLQHLLSLSRKVSHCQNSKNLDALVYGSNILQSLWNLAWTNKKCTMNWLINST